MPLSNKYFENVFVLLNRRYTFFLLWRLKDFHSISRVRLCNIYLLTDSIFLLLVITHNINLQLYIKPKKIDNVTRTQWLQIITTYPRIAASCLDIEFLAQWTYHFIIIPSLYYILSLSSSLGKRSCLKRSSVGPETRAPSVRRGRRDE